MSRYWMRSEVERVSGRAITAAVAALTAVATLGVRPSHAQDQQPERASGCYFAGGVDALEKGDLDLAEREFRGALKAFPGLLEARENLAITWARKGELNEAVEELKGILTDWPKRAEAHYNLGLVLLQKDHTHGALEHFRRAVELNPAYPEARNNLGLALEKAGDVGGALAEFHEAVRPNPRYAEALNNLGHLLAEKGEIDAAIAVYRAALGARPDFTEARLNLGSALWKNHELEPLPQASQRAADQLYVDTAKNLCDGLYAVMAGYKNSKDPEKRRAWEIWSKI